MFKVEPLVEILFTGETCSCSFGSIPHGATRVFRLLMIPLLTYTVGLSCGSFGQSILHLFIYLFFFLSCFQLPMQPWGHAALSQSLQVTHILRDVFNL